MVAQQKYQAIIVDAKGRIHVSSVVSVSSELPIAGDSGTDTVSLLTDTLTFQVIQEPTTTVTNNTVTVDPDDTAVTAGPHGSGTQIPTLLVDAPGRITAAGTATVSSDLPIAGDTGTDTVSLLTDTLTINGGTGVTSSVASDTFTLEIGQDVATTANVEFADITATGTTTATEQSNNSNNK